MFELAWQKLAADQYELIRNRAESTNSNRLRTGKQKRSRIEGLFHQVHKTLELLRQNPRHPGLRTHEYDDLAHPYERNGKVFEAYAQNKTPGAYRVFWCYGPQKSQLTIIAITPHP
jgi:hypothetical protein